MRRPRKYAIVEIYQDPPKTIFTFETRYGADEYLKLHLECCVNAAEAHDREQGLPAWSDEYRAYLLREFSDRVKVIPICEDGPDSIAYGLIKKYRKAIGKDY